jgi:hypothetical protein
MPVSLSTARSESGQSLVMFAVVLPLILFIAVLSVDIGNWWVHKKRLQTQVDAAALAAGPLFRGCFRSTATADPQIASEALKYAGDFHAGREPASPGQTLQSLNQQVQEPGDVFVALNSTRYWQQSDGALSPEDGYGLDYTMDDGNPATPTDDRGKPCSLKYLDVKATDDRVIPLWGRIKNWRDFPALTSPKTHAKIEARDIEAMSGMLPWAVPEIDPRAVVALFVNEDTGIVFDSQQLILSDDPDLPWSEWRTAVGQEPVTFDGVNDNTGVVILISKNDPTPATGGTLASVCNQAPRLVVCHGGSTATSGLSFIHGYNGGRNGTMESPQARQVELFDTGCSADDLSAPYFTLDGGCSAAVRAVIDFGVEGDPTVAPTCALVDGMIWSPDPPGSPPPNLGFWTGSIALPAGSGRNQLNIRTHTGPK